MHVSYEVKIDHQDSRAAFLAGDRAGSVTKIIIVPSRARKVRIEAQPRRPCLHHLDGECGCQHDVDEIASRGILGIENWPQIHLGR